MRLNASSLPLFLVVLTSCAAEIADSDDPSSETDTIAAPAPVQAPWAKSRQNARNTGASSLGPESPELRWRYAATAGGLGNNVNSDPVIDAAGNVYFGGREGVTSLTSAGAFRWRYTSAPSSVALAVQLLSDETALVNTSDGALHKISQQTGARQWAVTTGTQGTTTPFVVTSDGTIFIGSQNTTELIALDASGGKKWAAKLSGAPVGALGLRSDGLIYVAVGTPTGSTKPAVQVVDPRRKRVVWSWAPTGYTYAFLGGASVTADDRALVAAYGGGKVFALDPKVPGGVAWTWQSTTTQVSIWTPPVVGLDGTIYVAEGGALGIGGNKRVVALTAQGAVRWTATVIGNINVSPALSRNGTLYVMSMADVATDQTEIRLTAITAATGAIRWSHQFATTGVWPSTNVAPAIGHGRIYLGINEGYTGNSPSGPTQSGTLHALGAANLAADYGEGDPTPVSTARPGRIKIDSFLYTPKMGFAAWMPKNSAVLLDTPPLDVAPRQGLTWVWFGNVEGWVETAAVQLL